MIETKLEWWVDGETDTLIFHGRIAMRDLTEVPMSSLDRAVVIETPKTAADFLLSAELLFRRIQEHKQKKSNPTEKTP